jgi:uncharacterized OB-fold protein
VTAFPFPVPVRRTEESAEFFDMAAKGQLMLRRCLQCSAFRAPADSVCTVCYSVESEPVPAQGAGILVSWTVVHRSPVPGLDAPYIAALVECAEGPWVFVRLIADSDEELSAGMDLEFFTAASGDDGESVVAARTRRKVN